MLLLEYSIKIKMAYEPISDREHDEVIDEIYHLADKQDLEKYLRERLSSLIKKGVIEISIDESNEHCYSCRYWKGNKGFPNQLGSCTKFKPTSNHPPALRNAATKIYFGCVSWEEKR